MSLHPTPDRHAVHEARRAGEALATVATATEGILQIRDRAGRLIEVHVPGIAVAALSAVLETLGKGHSVRVLADDTALNNDTDHTRRDALDELTRLSDELGLYD